MPHLLYPPRALGRYRYDNNIESALLLFFQVVVAGRLTLLGTSYSPETPKKAPDNQTTLNFLPCLYCTGLHNCRLDGRLYVQYSCRPVHLQQCTLNMILVIILVCTFLCVYLEPAEKAPTQQGRSTHKPAPEERAIQSSAGYCRGLNNPGLPKPFIQVCSLNH